MTEDELAAIRAALQRTFRQVGEIVQAMLPPLPADSAPPDLAAIRADWATLKPRAQVSIITDAQERLLYEAVPALLALVDRLETAIATLEDHAATVEPGSAAYEVADAQLAVLYSVRG